MKKILMAWIVFNILTGPWAGAEDEFVYKEIYGTVTGIKTDGYPFTFKDGRKALCRIRLSYVEIIDGVEVIERYNAYPIEHAGEDSEWMCHIWRGGKYGMVVKSKKSEYRGDIIDLWQLAR